MRTPITSDRPGVVRRWTGTRHCYLAYAPSEFEELSNQEIADRPSLTLVTVKIRLPARALLHGELRRH